MNWVKRTTLTLSIILLITIISFAQGDIRRAKKFIELQDFDTAITNLNKIIAAGQGNQEAFIAIGDAYRLSNRLPEAHSAYSSARDISVLPVETNKSYGDVLMALNDYAGALEQYSLYGTEYQLESELLIAKCGYAVTHAADAPQFKVAEESINTTKRDFGAAFFGTEVVYLSSRTDLQKDKNINSHVNIELLKASPDSKGALKYPKRIKSLTGPEFNIISIAYNPSQNLVAITKGERYDNINLGSDEKCTLYIGKFDRYGSISNLKPYEFNKTDFSTGFASFSSDGTTMYFASDRVGGLGGFDIYESKIVGDSWSAPINLGSEVNTSGNEITPSRTGNVLLFASDARAGFGGYDVFKATEGSDGFANAENLGTGINSSFDEYGMIYDSFLNVGYLTSTRSQGKGLEDIYRVVSIQPLSASVKPVATIPLKKNTDAYEILKGMAVDARTGSPLAGVTVSAEADAEHTIVTAKTNNNGVFSIPLFVGKYYNINFNTLDYLSSSRTIQMESTRKMPLLKVEMEASYAVPLSDEPMIQPVALGTAKPRTRTVTAPRAASKRSGTAWTSELATRSSESVDQSTTTAVSDVSKNETAPASNYAAPTMDMAYAIQLAAISKNEKSNRFANVKDLGSLYTLFDSRVYKVRCGLFTNRSEAEEVLRRIRVRGYESAFIVIEKPTDSMDLVMMDFGEYAAQVTENQATYTASTNTVSQVRTQPVAAERIVSNYKVRLATYSNPKWFDQSKVEGPGFGFVEVLMNEGKSIYMLSGFDSLQGAEKANRMARQNGFTDAYVVKDENGQLSKVKY